MSDSYARRGMGKCGTVEEYRNTEECDGRAGRGGRGYDGERSVVQLPKRAGKEEMRSVSLRIKCDVWA